MKQADALKFLLSWAALAAVFLQLRRWPMPESSFLVPSACRKEQPA